MQLAVLFVYFGKALFAALQLAFVELKEFITVSNEFISAVAVVFVAWHKLQQVNEMLAQAQTYDYILDINIKETKKI